MRLSHRLALVFSLFGAAIAGGFQYTHVRETRAEMYSRVENMSDITLNAIKALVEAQTRGGKYIELGRNFEGLVRQAGVASIVVRDGRGRRLVGRSDDSRALARKAHPGTPLREVVDGFYDVEMPVGLGARGAGTVQLSFHTAAMDARLRQMTSQAVRAGVMSFLAVVLAAWVIGTWFGMSIERLVPSVEALPKDPERFRPLRPLAAGDEVSRLVAAFNRLGLTLKGETSRRRELEAERKELSAMLVHDLKTPLTVIYSGISLLQDQSSRESNNGESKSNKRTFELLNTSVSRLLRMVEDVLHLSRLEEIAGLREHEVFDLAALARATAKDFGLVAADRGQQLVVDIVEGEALVEGEQALLRRVLDNLLHNAVEHTPKGGEIGLKVAFVAEKKKQGVRVSISDSGPGIPPEARADIFRKFFQKDFKRHVGNVGLGLALCEKVIHRHQGTIGVEESDRKGARFYFILPRRASADVAPRA